MIPVNRISQVLNPAGGAQKGLPTVPSVRGNLGHSKTLAFGCASNHEVGGARKRGMVEKEPGGNAQATSQSAHRERQTSATKDHLPEPRSPAEMSSKSFMRLTSVAPEFICTVKLNKQSAYHSFPVPHYPTRGPGSPLTHARGIQTSLSATSWDEVQKDNLSLSVC